MVKLKKNKIIIIGKSGIGKSKYVKLPKHIAQNMEMERILSSDLSNSAQVLDKPRRLLLKELSGCIWML